MKQVQFVRMATGQAGAFTGPVGMVVVDTTSKAIRVQDGATPGGFATLVANNNLTDLLDKSLARTALELGTAAQQDVGAFDPAGSATAALNSAVASSAQRASNLSDLANAGTARTNLGLGTAAVLNTAAVAQTANNLSDLANAATARTNIGLGTASTLNLAQVAQTANNLSDLASAATARTNLGVGTMATRNVFFQNGGTPAGGADGDLFFIF